VADVQELAKAVAILLGDGHRVRAMARAAAATVDRLGGAVERTMQAIEPFLMQMQLEER
jgi:3-deoxy-D-manno-octulosonic-acid transferase